MDRLTEILSRIDKNNDNIVDICENNLDTIVGDKDSKYYEERYKLFCNAEEVAISMIKEEELAEQDKIDEQLKIKNDNEQKLKEIELQNKEELKIQLDSTAIIGLSIICITAIIITFMILHTKQRKAPLN